MATTLSRNATLRCAYRFLASYTLHHLRSTKPSFRLFHGAPPPSPHHRPILPLYQAEIQLDRVQSLAMYRKYLCISSATVSQTNSATNGSSEGNLRKEEKSDQSQNTAEQGKSVRGGSDTAANSVTDCNKTSYGFSNPISWLSFLLLVATGAGLIFYYDSEKRRHIEDINRASVAVKQGPSVGKAAIGGPFNLVNHNGKTVTDRDFLGKWTVMYFGFTHCPDICPDELQKLAAAVDQTKKNAGIEVVPVFISVDPERDTVEQVHEYVKEFHPNLIGLTGNPDEIKKVARSYRVYYMKTEEEGSDYLVDHSIVMYLMDPNMEFVKFYGKNNDVGALSDGIIREIKQYKKVKA